MSAKPEIISFKVDHALAELLKHVANRSEFIRGAILAALDKTCPLCNGSGILDDHQRDRWQAFAASHPLTECGRCHERVFTCDGKLLRHACAKHA
ncbi:MAG TPA: CopG family transcriptional regulator [Planctomycetota bacterium]|nr:CopG family transcriptional regulator [Planctomycetota bacterium]HYE05387.1 CopG family transcriptional regulator [Planctomycetota bacterium]